MYKVIVTTKSNIRQLAEGAKEKGRYRKILYDVAGGLSSSIKSNTPVKKKNFSSGRKNGVTRIKQESGNLKKSIGVFDSDSKNYVRVWVGARVKGPYDGWYAQIVHDGHKIYRNTNSVKRNPLKRWRNRRIVEKTQGYIKANPFISNVYNSQRRGLESSLKVKVGVDLETLIKQNNNA
ncbi:hypothetical protein ACKLNQ_02465 [Myroides odoratimimus]|uniref:hypothetical protein n=1 Tax=Myroides odoratimimus TaxID=76832 RepID=UPI0038D3953C